jgi:hypothetical protein
MQLCQELDKQPHEDLAPVIHLAAHSVRRSIEEAQQMHAVQAQAAVASAANGEGVSPEMKRAVKLPPDDLYVSVVCSNVTATLHPASCRVQVNGEEMSATHFEQYAGCGSAKKWRASVKLIPGQVPECPEGAHPVVFVGSSTMLHATKKYGGSVRIFWSVTTVPHAHRECRIPHE